MTKRRHSRQGAMKKSAIFIIGLCAVAVITLLVVRSPERPVYRKANYQGIDVSNHQGKIDWGKVAQDKNISFVYIKATEGATHKDRRYKENVEGARENGILVGSYHYLKGNRPIHRQFDNFKSVVDRDRQDLIPMVDVEETIDRDSLLLFCSLVKEHYGKLPLIYSIIRVYNSLCSAEFDDFYLMIARYGPKPPVIKGKNHYSIWQFSEDGKIDGISKPVDLDRLHPDFSLSSLMLNN